jgi:molecular chaperone DnaJ
VWESASADEIKKAYRKAAKKYHPDVTGGDKAKAEKFKEITEANETLSDPKKRAVYDEQRRNPFAGANFSGGAPGGGYPGGFGGMDIEELLRNMQAQQARGGGGGGGRTRVNVGGFPGGGQGGGFADMFGDLFSGGGAGARQAQRRGEDVAAKLEVELPEMALGAEKVLTIDGRRLTVKIPAGITDGKTIRLAGQGEGGGRGAPAGDLLIELHERPHSLFRRKAPGSPDIEVDVKVPLDVAILGGKVDVATLEGTTITLTVPPMTSSGKQMRARGKGATIPGTPPRRGDLYANVLVTLPEHLSPEAREHLEAFARTLRK